jgi:replicative DNA helicase
MEFSAPIFILKQNAKTLARREKIPLHTALDRVAQGEGFKAWSQLAAEWNSNGSDLDLLSKLQPGDLVLLAARPGEGKTLLGIKLAVESVARGNQAAFFTLEFTEADVERCCNSIDIELSKYREGISIDTSDQISAPYIAKQLAFALPYTLVVIDYLQLLDQKRENPDLIDQVMQLKRLAAERKVIIICLSQIDRRYDPESKACPGFEDIRLPNPVDISSFDKACFLSRGRMNFQAALGHKPSIEVKGRIR